ncbi:hypothetical protein [Deinococcus sp. QL22]|uniref:hypothetical protein n=1 Tax=Deinococcus sp. QL22 TaxID=2939437 RepID=UPI002017D3D6|nr:hypothetical protein [Deinococcus sp. QL22]UQN10843.1 hypothetical protein M1R55_31620 [Deinococcus sp. QL22]
MKFYDDLCKDAQAWLHLFRHEQASQMSAGEAAVGYFQVMHQVPQPIPRHFEQGDEPINGLSPEEIVGLDMLRSEVEVGHSLLPRMSSQVRRKVHDPLFSDWRILHFHLGTTLDRRGFYNRTNHTAFAFLDKHTFRLIAVWPHHPRPYEDIRLLHILKRDWPDVMEQYQAKGVTKLFPMIQTPEAIKMSRKKFMTMIDLDGVAYFPPGGGIVSNGYSSEAVMQHNYMANFTSELQHAWARKMKGQKASFHLLSPISYAIVDKQRQSWILEQSHTEQRFISLSPAASTLVSTIVSRLAYM